MGCHSPRHRALARPPAAFIAVLAGAVQSMESAFRLQTESAGLFDIRIHAKLARQSDGPIAALVDDLKARGLFDETLIVITGEFGRTPMIQNSGLEKLGCGRDHNPPAFTALLAGGGIKGGIAYGATDDFGFKAVENKVHVHDLHATILHQLGFDHTKLTFRHAGRDFRLTDVHGEVVKAVIA